MVTRRVVTGLALVGLCLSGILACSQLPLRGDGGPVPAIPLEWLRDALRDPIFNLFASAGVGAAAGAGVSWFFAVRSSSELRGEAKLLRLATDRVLRFLEAVQRGIDVETVRGADGEIEALRFKVDPETLSGEMPSGTGDLTVQRVYRPFPSD